MVVKKYCNLDFHLLKDVESNPYIPFKIEIKKSPGKRQSLLIKGVFMLATSSESSNWNCNHNVLNV